jgi:hypothetical protein
LDKKPTKGSGFILRRNDYEKSYSDRWRRFVFTTQKKEAMGLLKKGKKPAYLDIIRLDIVSEVFVWMLMRERDFLELMSLGIVFDIRSNKKNPHPLFSIRVSQEDLIDIIAYPYTVYFFLGNNQFFRIYTATGDATRVEYQMRNRETWSKFSLALNESNPFEKIQALGLKKYEQKVDQMLSILQNVSADNVILKIFFYLKSGETFLSEFYKREAEIQAVNSFDTAPLIINYSLPSLNLNASLKKQLSNYCNLKCLCIVVSRFLYKMSIEKSSPADWLSDKMKVSLPKSEFFSIVGNHKNHDIRQKYFNSFIEDILGLLLVSDRNRNKAALFFKQTNKDFVASYFECAENKDSEKNLVYETVVPQIETTAKTIELTISKNLFMFWVEYGVLVEPPYRQNIESSRTDIQFQLQLAFFLAEKTEQDFVSYSMPGVRVVSERAESFENGRLLTVHIKTFGLPHHRYKTKFIQVVFDEIAKTKFKVVLQICTSTHFFYRLDFHSYDYTFKVFKNPTYCFLLFKNDIPQSIISMALSKIMFNKIWRKSIKQTPTQYFLECFSEGLFISKAEIIKKTGERSELLLS